MFRKFLTIVPFIALASCETPVDPKFEDVAVAIDASATALATPAEVRASANRRGFTVSFNIVDGAVDYRVEYRIGWHGPWTVKCSSSRVTCLERNGRKIVRVDSRARGIGEVRVQAVGVHELSPWSKVVRFPLY